MDDALERYGSGTCCFMSTTVERYLHVGTAVVSIAAFSCMMASLTILMPWCGSIVAFAIIAGIGGLFVPLIYASVSIFGNCFCPTYGGASEPAAHDTQGLLVTAGTSSGAGAGSAPAASPSGAYVSPFADADAFSQEAKADQPRDAEGFYSPTKDFSGASQDGGVPDWRAGGTNNNSVLSTRSSTPLCIAAWTLRTFCVLAVGFTWILGFAAVYARGAASVRHTGSMRFGHLQHEVTLTYGGAGETHDGHGTVHISARTMHDAAFALGVNHAQMRLWQLEFQRRVGQGRLSEIVGEGGIEMDQVMRALDIYEAAKLAKPTLSQEATEVLQAYADGINQWVQSKHSQRPLEFTIFGVKTGQLEPWKIEDSLVWAKIMAWGLAGNLAKCMDRYELNILGGLSVERTDQLMPAFNTSRFPIALSPAGLDPQSYPPTNPANTYGCNYPYTDPSGNPNAGGNPWPLNETSPQSSSNARDSTVPSDGEAVVDMLDGRLPSQETQQAMERVMAAVRAAFGADGDASLADGATEAAARAAEASSRASINDVAPEGLNFGRFGQLLKGEGLGASNAWVIGGSRTQSGKPLLCNDPHLTLMAPSIWLATHLKAIGNGTDEEPQLDAMGAVFVGLPSVVLGRNRHIAWGVTNTGADVQDIYAMNERPNPNGGEPQYMYKGEWVDYTIRREEIKIKGKKKPMVLNVKETPYGPVITDLQMYAKYRPSSSFPPLALRWLGSDKTINDTTYESFFRIQQSRNHAEWEHALRTFVDPSQNMMYADTQGNIGYRMTGKVPVRDPEFSGAWVVPGEGDPKYDWKGFLEFDQMPAALNPPEDFIVTANNRIVPPTYPHKITQDWDSGSVGYRAKRISDLICQAEQANHKLSRDDMPDIQLDYRSYQSADILRGAVSLGLAGPEATEAPLSLSNNAAAAVRAMANWTSEMPVGSTEATLMAMWRRALAHRTKSVTGDVVWANGGWLWNAFAGGDSQACPQGCGVLLAQALGDVEHKHGNLVKAVSRGARAPLEYRWGQGLHMGVFEHLVLGKSPIKCLANRAIGHGGDGSTVNVGKFDMIEEDGDLHQVAGPSYRQIVDLSAMESSRYLNPLGQDGNEFSLGYTALLDKWAKGQYLPMALESYGGDQLKLKP